MNIYVGNLVYAITSDELKNIFTQYGDVESASVITFHSGKSKGFGFVTMPNDEQAKAAIDALNGTDLQGRQVIVNEARPKEDKPREHRPRNFKRHDRR